MSLELGGGWSLKNAKGVRGQSWKNSETASERKTGRPLTLLESNGHQLSRTTCIGVEIKSENHKKISTISTMSVK